MVIAETEICAKFRTKSVRQKYAKYVTQMLWRMEETKLVRKSKKLLTEVEDEGLLEG